MMGWQWHQLDNMQIIYTSLQTDNHASTSSLNLYRLDALPDAPPTVSKQELQVTSKNSRRHQGVMMIYDQFSHCAERLMCWLRC